MTLTVVDMHTGGEPLRIVTGGYPSVPKGTILEKRAYVRDHLDHLRKILMFEPRGHYDMYGALLVEPDLPGADLAVLFMHNEGYSTMCGHAIVALGRYAVDEGLVAKQEPITTVNIEAPCGLVVASVEVRDGKAGAVAFESVPAFLFAGGQTIELAGHGTIGFDVAYGGAFYALADCHQFGLEFGKSRVRDFVDAATALTDRLKAEFPLSHPDHGDLAFLYGTILTDGRDAFSDGVTKNICVFAEAEVDRSPTGSGVTARLAAMHAKGEIAIGQTRTFESIAGSRFSGAVVRTAKAGPHGAIIARVGGRAYYSGRTEFIVEADDELGRGFLLR
ncbi:MULTISPECIES: proline racemase family protein [unclassified Mesorhizobium]|jgi:proline racemase|uniref:proline racemase family protein n=2 Tax=Mesorhizobium TaxID=68287 RepID=UPI000FCBD9F3|nr:MULTISPECIES: proline racemase family protein [unclassified Mesorhizobium]RUU61038.1 proline racemase [Mesorhizobium sp. M7A.T.Ca.TU.009.01.1.1]RUT81102.1 proline racemase [Mesorhizobium sp. M7A.T.Ca.US.000.02.1.1]RUT92203.1 proline racemase [Mesorhizobium sp. M7A.T.Ca.US.000.02.2.1]RUT99768.1 proline racemase [Mesorhizobium sp. M7A.T.Ca.TU.009.02.1.1]RWN14546.1 MAG: proline racemase [Mesorhizobium sp.]